MRLEWLVEILQVIIFRTHILYRAEFLYRTTSRRSRCGGREGGVIEGAETSIMHPNHHPLRRISKGFKKVHYAFLVAKTLMDFEFEALRTVVTQLAVFSADLSELYNLCSSVGN